MAVEEVPHEDTSLYGIVEPGASQDGGRLIQSIIEKPAAEDAPSNLGVVGRYIFNPTIFDELEQVTAGAGGEIQLTDAISSQIDSEDVLAYAFEGVRYDCGSKMGFVKATVSYALDHEDMRQELIEYVLDSVNSRSMGSG